LLESALYTPVERNVIITGILSLPYIPETTFIGLVELRSDTSTGILPSDPAGSGGVLGVFGIDVGAHAAATTGKTNAVAETATLYFSKNSRLVTRHSNRKENKGYN
jgi:hypothetical protein